VSSLGFVFNFNIQRCEVEVDRESLIIKEGYWPLLTTLAERGVKANLYISGYSTESILKLDPHLVEYIRTNMETLFRLGSYTYSHPIPQLLSQAEMLRQIRRGMRIDEDTYGVKVKGFFPPEFSFTRALAGLLWDCSIEYVIVLSDLLSRDNPEATQDELRQPYNVTIDSRRMMRAVPITLDLPGSGRRFFKRMLWGDLSPKTAAESLFTFLDKNENVFLILERDAETIYVDALERGPINIQSRLETFLDLILDGASRRDIPIEHIEEHLALYPPTRIADPSDYLGNTKIETFTEGRSLELWERTKVVQQRLLAFEGRDLRPQERRILEEAWEHMLLAHNSDGRIGFWHSDWKPGEHEVVSSRREFVEKELEAVVHSLDRMEGR